MSAIGSAEREKFLFATTTTTTTITRMTRESKVCDCFTITRAHVSGVGTCILSGRNDRKVGGVKSASRPVNEELPRALVRLSECYFERAEYYKMCQNT